MFLKKNSGQVEKLNQAGRFIYGPVLSRRLGLSLGIDILPPKTCNFNCLYCQLGPTKKIIEKRHPYYRVTDIIEALKTALEHLPRIDYLTFSGSGEPTLNTHLGRLIREIKQRTTKPVAVLTNSLLLKEKEVREELALADLVVPSLDAAEQSLFLQINRPNPAVHIDGIIDGLIRFREEFHGQIWLEVMLIKGMNDKPEPLLKLKDAIAKIRPHKIQLNTVVRPPAEAWVEPLGKEEMVEVSKILGPSAEVIIEATKRVDLEKRENLENSILSILKRRPASEEELASLLSESKEKVQQVLEKLLAEKKVQVKDHYHRRQFEYFWKGK
ncbi:MAG: radical SAM protein [Candidatus Aminicenantes bacterium]|nr:radical SAM protein [Candidatus Aminicenantes bacterium]